MPPTRRPYPPEFRSEAVRLARSSGQPVAPDRVKRVFTATAPNQLWVADITYVATWEGWLFLAVVIDAFSRRCVGWSMRDDLKADLVVDALGMAVDAPQTSRRRRASLRPRQPVRLACLRCHAARLGRTGLHGQLRRRLRQRRR